MLNMHIPDKISNTKLLFVTEEGNKFEEFHVGQLSEPTDLLEYRYALEREASTCDINTKRLFAMNRLLGNRYFQIAAEGIEIPIKLHRLLLALRCAVIVDDDIVDNLLSLSKIKEMKSFRKQRVDEALEIAHSISNSAFMKLNNATIRYDYTISKMKQTDFKGWKLHSLETKMQQMNIALLPIRLLSEFGISDTFIRTVCNTLFYLIKSMQIMDDLFDYSEDIRLKIRTSIFDKSNENKEKTATNDCIKYLNKAKFGLGKDQLICKYIEKFKTIIYNQKRISVYRKNDVFPIQPFVI